MGMFTIRGWDVIVPGCGEISCPAGNSRCSLVPSGPANCKFDGRAGVFALSRALSAGCPFLFLVSLSCTVDVFGILIIRICNLIVSVSGRTSTLSQEATRAARRLHEPPAKHKTASGVGFSTHFVAVSTRELLVLVFGLL